MSSQQSPFAVGGVPSNRHVEAGKGIALCIALPVMVGGFMRSEVGFLNLSYGSLFVTTFGMLMFTWLVNLPLVAWFFGNGIAKGDASLRFFAVVFLAAGLYQRRQRKQEKWSPDRLHGHSLGVTRFAFLPLREDYIYRYVDPAVTFLVGSTLRYLLRLPLLGLYWMIAAVAFFLVEFSLHQQTEINDWGLGDRKKEAERDGDVFKAMTGQPEPKRGSRATHGIPTGVDGLDAHIEKNRKERACGTAGEGSEL